jgi:hypothetical protein
MGSAVSCLGVQALKPQPKTSNTIDKEEMREKYCGIGKSKLMTDWLVI